MHACWGRWARRDCGCEGSAVLFSTLLCKTYSWLVKIRTFSGAAALLTSAGGSSATSARLLGALGMAGLRV
jgi:hypothetical protein